MQTWYDNELPSPSCRTQNCPGYFKLNADMNWEDSLFGVYPQDIMTSSYVEEVNSSARLMILLTVG